MTKIITVSGFLGAGKTTAIAELADYYINNNFKIAIVTNDQGSDLVDTAFFNSKGYYTKEIFGGCFCCSFDKLETLLLSIKEEIHPDIILAESVGSCTDLYATVILPLKSKYPDSFTVCPLITLADPLRIQTILGSIRQLFPHEIDYLFKKQLEESQILVMTKSDLYTQEQFSDIQSLIPYKENRSLFEISSKSKKGINALADFLLKSDFFEQEIMELDYDEYAIAEKYLGWFNMKLEFTSPTSLDINDFCYDYLSNALYSSKSDNEEIAHLKLFARSNNDYLKISLSGNESGIDFNHKMSATHTSFELIANARINCHPDIIHIKLSKILSDLVAKHDLTYNLIELQYFQPGKPDPDARIKNLIKSSN